MEQHMTKELISISISIVVAYFVTTLFANIDAKSKVRSDFMYYCVNGIIVLMGCALLFRTYYLDNLSIVASVPVSIIIAAFSTGAVIFLGSICSFKRKEHTPFIFGVINAIFILFMAYACLGKALNFPPLF